MKPVRERFKQSERIIASFVIGNDETLVHVAQAAGVHVLILDFEHGMMTKDAARRFINAARHTDVAIFARCPKGDVYGLNALLDHGLHGVIVTESQSVDDVEAIIRQVKFAPSGKRGMNPFIPAASFGGVTAAEFAVAENERTSVWIMAENRAILENIDEVCALPDVDGVFFGPYDLSVDCDVPGQVQHPTVEGLLERGITAAQSKGLATGIFVKRAADAGGWVDKGVQMLALGVDLATLADSWREAVRTIDGMQGGKGV